LIWREGMNLQFRSQGPDDKSDKIDRSKQISRSYHEANLTWSIFTQKPVGMIQYVA